MKYEISSYHTKKMLAESLKTALLHKPFSKVTVSEIIRDCGVNRKTFYYHFQDIYALFKWILDEEAFQPVKGFDLLADYTQAVRFAMNYILDNRYLLNCISDPVAVNEIKLFYYNDFASIVLSTIESAESLAGKALDPSLKKFLSKFYTEAILSMLIDWARNKPNESYEITAEYLSTIIGAAFQTLLTQLDLQNPDI